MKYSDAVKNAEHNIHVFSGPYAHYHGNLRIKKDPATLMVDANDELCGTVLSKVQNDNGITDVSGVTVDFAPKDSNKRLGNVEKCYVQFGQQPTTFTGPHVHALKEEVGKLKLRVDYLETIVEPTRYRQLIEGQRYHLWTDYGSDFALAFPDSVARDQYYSEETEGLVTEVRPRRWSEFLGFVKKKLVAIPTYWELLKGGYGTDFSAFSDVIHSLPDKRDFLRVLRPTGAYAELFADVYGVTVEACLEEDTCGELQKSISDKVDSDDHMPFSGTKLGQHDT